MPNSDDKPYLPLSNTRIDNFLKCKRLYKTLLDYEIETRPDYFALGSAVDAGLGELDKAWNLDNALMAMLAVATVEVREQATQIIRGYADEYRTRRLEYISTQTDITASIGGEVTYHSILDGFVTWDGAFWVLERKTSGLSPELFFKQYAWDRQALGHLFVARTVLPEVKGVIVDVIFKNRGKTPTFDRRPMIYSQADIGRWHAETLEIYDDMLDAHKHDRFYGADKGQCNRGAMECELWGSYCSQGLNPRGLLSTHRLRTRKEKA